MFFLLSKLLLFLLSPLTWVIVGLGLTFFSKSARWKKRGKVTAIFCLLFFSNTFIYKEVCRQWEVFGTPINKVKHYDVGIVLGGMAEYNNDLKTLSLRRGGDRIWQTIDLYKSGKIDKILISGDNGDLTNKGLHEAKQMKAILVRWGIPKEDIITETVSRNTHQNAVETKKVLDKYYPHYKSFILITSGRHMRRALACYENAGLYCTPYSTDLYTGPKRSYTFDEFIVPDVSTMADWHGLLKEMVGYVAYGMTGKI
ncbi:MAG: hypothetical protein A3D31_04240 [Candidatus Fluviicola riflensis]|nr:MAG: hypothetical protein CHH17_10790 [Candidatus Fluviicola riflensis]OGS79185.1 MAG: hypothetical protein A3D31_04240 [Candidatus Fluviicola riflensis]OGS86617.1 MAG: hypothetical protein A2724_03700 [Fluviicola sp. RIFCSPHIGHO2_01_FULL_43_53]OGS88909.1 MAG: hypothetical protein A3E30_00960 [Fluviicola sp. RIFCSPHIGHO2_12_FULL_43_24]